MNKLRPACALAALCCSHVAAQTPPSTAQTPLSPTLSPVVVTATPIGSELFELAAPASVLEGPQLRLRTQSTLGETLGAELGVSSTYFGPNASRPVIRGLDGDRIRVLQNGAGVIDASAASVDHATSVEPLLIERAEVVRGPATLMYGGNAVGGVVNVTDGRILQEPLRGARASVDARFGAQASERAQVARVALGDGLLALTADFARRHAADLRIPDYARSARRRESAPLPPQEEPRGRLPNSGLLSDGAGLGMSFAWNKGYAGLSGSQYNARYGTVAEPDVTIGLQQRRYEFASELRDVGGLVKALRFKSAVSDYKHIEYEQTSPGTQFETKGHNTRVEVLHHPIGRVQGALGLELQQSKFSALGDEAFVPNTRTQQADMFVYEEAQLGAVKLSGGVRLGRAVVRALDDARFGEAESRRFSPKSGALGALYSFNPVYALALQGSYNERAPTFQELYANGPHIATNAFEVGDRSLGLERSYGLDLALRKRVGSLTGSLGVYYNRFRNYIGLFDSGAIDQRDPVDPDDDLAIYRYRVVPADFRGVEGQLRWRAIEASSGRLSLESRIDTTRARNRQTGQSLPRIPPLRFGGAVIYELGGWMARLDLMRAAKQDRVSENEVSTDGYTMLDAAVSYRVRLGSSQLEWFVRGTNLLNVDARLHTSFLKEVAPLGRRGATIGVRASF